MFNDNVETTATVNSDTSVTFTVPTDLVEGKYNFIVSVEGLGYAGAYSANVGMKISSVSP